jgi:pimeloyl-ACP methyl ester carboxylesterase
MPTIELSAGSIEYEDTGGSGPVVVLLHGLVMDASVWRHVIRDLRADHRCLAPTLPVGSHRRPMRADADLSLRGLARLEAEFLERLDLREVTLVGNDLGLFQVTASENPERLARLVITSCEAFENIPPGLPGHVVTLAAKVPGGLKALTQPLRWRALRRLPVALGWMAKRPIPHEITDAWLRPLLTQRAIRRDLLKYLRHFDKGDLVAAAERLRSFERPTLIVWAAEDRVMPPAHGRKLAALIPHARLVEIVDSYTLLPEDQPVKLAARIREFIAENLGVAQQKGSDSAHTQLSF